jgi:transposase
LCAGGHRLDRHPGRISLAYEVLSGNTADKTTLREFLKKVERQYGQAERISVMDRGIPTEEVLTEMRQSVPPVRYLVGTPKGRLEVDPILKTTRRDF